MAPNPAAVMAVVLMGTVFTAMLNGTTAKELNLDGLDFADDNPACTGGFVSKAWCKTVNFFDDAVDGVVAAIRVAFAAMYLFVGFLTFNVDGAPWWIRVPLGGTISTSLVWSIVGMIRGN